MFIVLNCYYPYPHSSIIHRIFPLVSLTFDIGCGVEIQLAECRCEWAVIAQSVLRMRVTRVRTVAPLGCTAPTVTHLAPLYEATWHPRDAVSGGTPPGSGAHLHPLVGWLLAFYSLQHLRSHQDGYWLVTARTHYWWLGHGWTRKEAWENHNFIRMAIYFSGICC